MSFQQKNLPQLYILNQINSLPVDKSQDFHLQYILRFLQKNQPSHLIYQQNNLPQLYIMNQSSTLPLYIPQYYHIHSHMAYHWRSLSQLQLMNQVTLPLYIPPFSLSQTQPQCSINPTKRLKRPFPLLI